MVSVLCSCAAADAPQAQILPKMNRAPMNQDEFDTKFNFVSNHRNRRRSSQKSAELAPDFSARHRCSSSVRRLLNAVVRSPRDAPEHFVVENAYAIAIPGVEPRPSALLRCFPIAEWLPKYRWRDAFPHDFFAGVVLTAHVISQALAYAFLAGLPPIIGLYSSLFPILVYIFTGTSHHSSIGTNIIVSFLTRSAVERFSGTSYDRILVEAFETKNATLLETPPVDFFQLATTVTLLTGCVHLAIVVFRLDFLLSYVPPTVISGFSFGIGVRIVVSQLRHLVQLSAKAPCDTVFSVACVASLEHCFREINPFVVAFSSCSLLFLLLVKQLLNPLLQMRVHAPFPFEFLLIIFATLMSVVMEAGEKFDVRTLQYSKQGFTISLPRVDTLDDFALDAVAIAFYALCVHLHLAKEVAKKKHYVVSQRQETLTFSVFEVLTAFFSGLPIGSSRSRTETLLHVGAHSLLYNVVVVAGIVPAILWGMPLFSALPLCVLSGVSLCGLRSAFSGVFTLVRLRRLSTVDTCSWLASALSAALVANASNGLGAAIVFVLFTVVFRTQWPRCQLLVNVTGSGSYYAEKSRYASDPMEDNGIAVIRFEAPLVFANVAQFKREVHAFVEATRGQIMAVGIGTRTGSMKSNCGAGGGRRHSVSMRSTLLISGDIVPNYDNSNVVDPSLTKIAILDCASINYVDTAGLEAMVELFEELNAKQTRLFFATVSASIRDQIQAVHGFEDIPKNCFFPSVHDAVLSAQQIGGVVASNIHMSVSLNGCRDLITLSTANSNHDDLTQRHDGASVSISGFENPVQVHPRPSSADSRRQPSSTPSFSRPSLPEARTTPPIVVSQPLRATTSNS